MTHKTKRSEDQNPDVPSKAEVDGFFNQARHRLELEIAKAKKVEDSSTKGLCGYLPHLIADMHAVHLSRQQGDGDRTQTQSVTDAYTGLWGHFYNAAEHFSHECWEPFLLSADADFFGMNGERSQAREVCNWAVLHLSTLSQFARKEARWFDFDSDVLIAWSATEVWLTMRHEMSQHLPTLYRVRDRWAISDARAIMKRRRAQGLKPTSKPGFVPLDVDWLLGSRCTSPLFTDAGVRKVWKKLDHLFRIPDFETVAPQAGPEAEPTTRRQTKNSHYVDFHLDQIGEEYSKSAVCRGLRLYRRKFKDRSRFPVPSFSTAQNAVRHRIKSRRLRSFGT